MAFNVVALAFVANRLVLVVLVPVAFNQTMFVEVTFEPEAEPKTRLFVT